MNCELVQNWILQRANLRPRSWPRKTARHVKGCVACRECLRSVRRLERSWKHEPIPVESEQAKARFLAKLATLTPAARPVRNPWRLARWIAVAAVLLIGIGVFSTMYFLSPGPTRASTDVVERLVDWNTDLTNADVKTRKRLLAENAVKFHRELQSPQLPADERELAQELFESGLFLATHNDLAAEAERINNLADRMKDRILIAEKKGDAEQAKRCSICYGKIYDRGVGPISDRIANQMKIPDKKGDAGLLVPIWQRSKDHDAFRKKMKAPTSFEGTLR